jgi:phosphoribosylanthranilate isomerase
MYRPCIKICCISSVDEARLAVTAGAHALGLVGHMPSGPGVISDPLISEIAQATPPGVSTFLLTSETTAGGIAGHYKKVFTTTIQLVDTPEPGTYEALRKMLPGVKLVQVIHVLNDASIAEALAVANNIDALLLDSGNPNLAVKELGGTGRVHNWDISRAIVEQCTKPVFLAGGLRAENVKKAIDAVRPYGLDLCTGVRTGGKLDLSKLAAFFEAVDRR